MPFALVLTLIAVVSTAFLAYQYFAGSLLIDDGAERPATASDADNLREFPRPHDVTADHAA